MAAADMAPRRKSKPL